ncbi:hypothetical protein SMA77_27715, partial [Escherichia coli]
DVFAGKKSAQIREILISESAWEEMTCLFAPSLYCFTNHRPRMPVVFLYKLSEVNIVSFETS